VPLEIKILAQAILVIIEMNVCVISDIVPYRENATNPLVIHHVCYEIVQMLGNVITDTMNLIEFV
jgi:hypothetical protein